MILAIGFLKSIAQWLYAFAGTIGGPGLLLIAVADSSFLSIPEGNDLLIVVLSIGSSWSRVAYLVSMTITGSVIGCLLLFAVGRSGGRALLEKRFSRSKVQLAQKYMQRYGIFSIMIPCILPPPTPFKIFVLTAGVFRLTVGRFLIAVVVGRTIRYSMWGILAMLYGERAKTFMMENLTWVGTLLLGALVAFALVVLFWRYAIRRRAHVGT